MALARVSYGVSAAARRPASVVARSLHAARHGWASGSSSRRSRQASGPGGLQQNVNLFLRWP